MACSRKTLSIWPMTICLGTDMSKSIKERIVEADEQGSRWLADANEAAERGEKAKAERLYAKVQHWLDL